MEIQIGAGRRIDTLDPAECLVLLGTVPVGRVAYWVSGTPRIEVINYVVDRGSVYIRMNVGDKSAAVARGNHFALEADRIDEVNGTGWDVTVVGPVTWLIDSEEIERAERLLHAWAPGERPKLAKIGLERILGRRISIRDPVH